MGDLQTLREIFLKRIFVRNNTFFKIKALIAGEFVITSIDGYKFFLNQK